MGKIPFAMHEETYWTVGVPMPEVRVQTVEVREIFCSRFHRAHDLNLRCNLCELNSARLQTCRLLKQATGARASLLKKWEITWLRPEAVAEIKFAEWTTGGVLRHAEFVALRDDTDPKEVLRENVV